MLLFFDNPSLLAYKWTQQYEDGKKTQLLMSYHKYFTEYLSQKATLSCLLNKLKAKIVTFDLHISKQALSDQEVK